MALPYQNQMNQYKKMRVETASPEMLILMLYDGAVKNIALAQQIIGDKSRIEDCNNAFIKAQNIITELMSSLNFDIGGDIAKNLFNIYEYINYTLAQANVTKTGDNLDAVLTMLKELRNTWQEVIKINREKYPNGIPNSVVEQEKSNTEPQSAPSANAEPEPATPANNNQQQQQQPANRFKQIYGPGFSRKA
jgi:flagellar protein FliS